MTSHCGLSYCLQKVGRHRWHGLNVSVLSKQAKYKGAYGFKTSCTPATVSWNIGCTFFFSEKCDLHHPGSNWEPLSGLQSSENGKFILIAKCSFITQDTRMEMYREMYIRWWWRRRLVTHPLLIWARQIWREIWFLEMKGWTAQQQAAKSKFSKSVINTALHSAYIKRQ